MALFRNKSRIERLEAERQRLEATAQRLEADLAFIAGFIQLKDKGHATASEHKRAAFIAEPYMDNRFGTPRMR